MAEQIKVEVAFATPDKQVLITLLVDLGSTVADAITASGIKDRFSGRDWRSLDVGIWGETCSEDRRLQVGDRVEIYRPLQIDPRASRRLLAQAGKTMRRS